ncbi:VOC family protein [Haladaptatus halobius]|nr:VOC family protein [Haladaptatus halobius]
MITELTHATVLVEDTDEALSWYTEKMGFETRSDEEFAPGMR